MKNRGRIASPMLCSGFLTWCVPWRMDDARGMLTLVFWSNSEGPFRLPRFGSLAECTLLFAQRLMLFFPRAAFPFTFQLRIRIQFIGDPTGLQTMRGNLAWQTLCNRVLNFVSSTRHGRSQSEPFLGPQKIFSFHF